MANQWKLNKSIFGPLWEYIIDDDITDIDWDGDSLWVSYAKGETERKDEPEITQAFIDNFTQYVANHVSRPFNQVENVLSAETDTLRITVAHESLVMSGRCFSIRKSMPKLRFTVHEALEDGYCPEEFMHFLVNCVKLHKNFAFCGEPGHGKTECAKFLSSFIQPYEKVITVEDTLEWHYKFINEGKRADEIKVNSNADYTKAIKLAVRLNPTWLMLSEARSTEVQYLIEGWSTGLHGMTTLHTDDVRNIPDRAVNMMDRGIDPDRMVNNIYSYLDIGVLLEMKTDPDGTKHRRIKQAAIFNREGEYNICTVIMENGQFNKNAIPKSLMDEFRLAGIENPFCSEDLTKRMQDEDNGIFYGKKEHAWIEEDENDEITIENSSYDENGLFGAADFDMDDFVKSVNLRG